MENIILTGDRPTGRLHVGHFVGSLKQRVELHDNINRDIINYYFDKGYLSIEFLFLRNGKLIGHNNKIIPVMEDYISELEYYIALYYNKHEVPKEVLIYKAFEGIDAIENIYNMNITIPEKGKKKELINLACNTTLK